MYISRRLFSYKKWNNASAEWLNTKWGRRVRIGLLGGTIIVYPITSMVINGPMVNQTFPRRYELESVPQYLEPIVKEEYERFLDKEGRIEKDAVFKYDLLKTTEQLDTVTSGSLGVRTGLRMGLPFYSKFTTVEEALQYFRQRQGKLNYLGEDLHIDWDTPSGQELAEAFVLTEKAKRFLILRDYFAHDGYAALAQRSISWATWTTFTSLFTYWLHRSAIMFGGTAVSFLGIYGVFVTAAWFANRHWHYLYRYVTDVYADSVSAHTSFDHCEGGKEFYWKMLKRNRLIRDMHPTMYTKVTPSGDIRGIPTPLITRFDHLKDLSSEDDELKDVVGGDF